MPGGRAGHGGPCPCGLMLDATLLFLGAGCGGGFVGVLLLEALDAAGCVDQLLFASEERMALGADSHADQLAFCGGAGLERAAAGAVHRDGVIIGVNSFFHERLLSAGRSA